MNVIVFLSFISVLGFLASAVVLVKRKRRIRLSSSAFVPLLLAILLYAFIVLSNLLEHSGITSFFDPLEDVAEIVFTFVFLFFVNNWRKQKSYEAIKNQEAWHRVTLESIADGILATDRKGRVIQMNKAMEVFTGCRQSEAFGREAATILTFLDKDSEREVSYRPFEKVLSGSAPEGYSRGILLQSRNGDTRSVADSTSVIRSPTGELLGAVGIFRDMSRYESLMMQLTHNRKMEAVGQLAGGVAHDLNNMLGGIMGATDVLRLDFSENGVRQYDRLLDIISDSVRNAGDLTSNLLAFSRRGKIVSSPIAVQEVIQKTVAIAERTLGKQIDLQIECPDDPLMIIGDPYQLQNALLNLMINARDAMPKGGRITITARPKRLDSERCKSSDSPLPLSPGDYIRIDVIDEGVGISPENQERIFEPFFTTKAEGQGTGLGLAAVHGTVSTHHGGIEIKSTAGQGTTFSLYFPKSHGREKQPSDRGLRQPTGKGTVLVIEDEALLGTSTKIMLEHGGYRVYLASSGAEGLRIYEKHRKAINVVLLDMIMPEMDGLEVFKKLRQIDDSVRVVMTSGFTQQANIPEGVKGFIKKPYTYHELVTSLAEGQG